MPRLQHCSHSPVLRADAAGSHVAVVQSAQPVTGAHRCKCRTQGAQPGQTQLEFERRALEMHAAGAGPYWPRRVQKSSNTCVEST